MRFNPPPNWPPVPPGWTPPAGWQPDPAWPPAPPGWQLWVAEGPPPQRRNLAIVGGLAVALLLVAGAVVTVVALRSPSGSSTATSTPTSVNEKSDDEQIKDAVTKFEHAWNDKDFAGFTPILCEKMRRDKEFNEADFLDARGDTGRVTLDVESIEVHGDSATATITHDGDDADQVDFVREDGVWKWCKL